MQKQQWLMKSVTMKRLAEIVVLLFTINASVRKGSGTNVTEFIRNIALSSFLLGDTCQSDWRHQSFN